MSCTGVEGATAYNGGGDSRREPSPSGWDSQVKEVGDFSLFKPAASSEKDSSSDSDSELLESGKEMKGYRVVGCETLGRVVSEACVRSVCTSPLVVVEDLGQRRVLVSNFSSRATTHSRDLTYIPYLSADWQTFSPNVQRLLISNTGNILTCLYFYVYKVVIHHLKALSLLYKMNGSKFFKFIRGGVVHMDVARIRLAFLKNQLLGSCWANDVFSHSLCLSMITLSIS